MVELRAMVAVFYTHISRVRAIWFHGTQILHHSPFHYYITNSEFIWVYID